MGSPQIRFAHSGDLSIAYQVVGNGPIDLVFVPGLFSNLELSWEDPGYSRLFRRLSGFTRVIQFDKRGTGLSDPVNPIVVPGTAERMDDIRAVMDAAGSGRAVLLGSSEGAALSVLFAATYPARTRALLLFGGYAHFQTGVMGGRTLDDFICTIENSWGSGATLPHLVPSRVQDIRFKEWWARFERLSASPSGAVALARMNAHVDVRGSLNAVGSSTLVLHRRDDAYAKLAAGRQLADKIKGARFAELPGRDHVIWTGEIDRIADAIEEFITGTRPVPSQHRVLMTILAARLIEPERLARRMGDSLWHERFEKFQQASAGLVMRFGGEMAVTGAEEICARFDSPGRAIGCAIAMRDAARALDLKLAAGVHTGEVELYEGAISGYVLHVTERISSQAEPNQVLVSSVVCDLVSGSGFHFVEQPIERNRVSDPQLRLFSVMVEQHLEPMARSAKTSSLDVLSSREREVLVLVADGLSNAAIANHLDLSEHTVKRHVANILVKLDLPTRAAAAAMVSRDRAG